MSRSRVHWGFVAVVVAWLAASPAVPSDPRVSRVVVENPLFGFRIEIPEDWEMGCSDVGNLLLGLDAGSTVSPYRDQPLLWFFSCRKPPEATARELAAGLRGLGARAVEVGAREGEDAWDVTATVGFGSHGALLHRYRLKREGRSNYGILAMVRPDAAAVHRDDIEAALRTCRRMRRVPAKRFKEPTENAYLLLVPEGWRWEGRIIRARGVPGYFEWKVQHAEGAKGAFNGAPAILDVTHPYVPAAEAASTYVLRGLATQVPGLRFVSARDQPRAGEVFTAGLRALGNPHPRVHKATAVYEARVGDMEIRIRATIATVMMNAPPITGGRGTWMIFTSGVWAPKATFAKDAALGQAVLSSISTDPEWKARQQQTVSEVRLWAAKVRDTAWKNFDEYIRGDDDPGGDDPGGDDPGDDDPGGDDDD